MKIENGKLVLERKNCSQCNKGRVPSQIDCPKCSGTGNGPRGGKNGCKSCHGLGSAFDHKNPETCSACSGSYENFELETPFNHIYLSKNDIPVKVIRDKQDRERSFEEQYIGLGLFSCTDYGAHENQNDKELIESAFHFEQKGTFWTQGIKLVKSKTDLQICNYLAIITGQQGYSVLPMFEEQK